MHHTVLDTTLCGEQAQLTAVDLLTYATADDMPKRFLHAAAEDIAPFIKDVREGTLAHVAAYGIGFLHEGLSAKEHAAILALHSSGALQVSPPSVLPRAFCTLPCCTLCLHVLDRGAVCLALQALSFDALILAPIRMLRLTPQELLVLCLYTYTYAYVPMHSYACRS